MDVLALLGKLPPVRAGVDAWLAAARQLIAAGSVEEAELLLSTLAQSHDRDVQLRVMLVELQLRIGRWTEALATARHALAFACSTSSIPPSHRAAAATALALALGHVARCTPVMAPSERSKCRAEARALLEPLVGPLGEHASGRHPHAHAHAGQTAAAAGSVLSGAARAEALYYLALLNAEGGHFGSAVEAARGALAACPTPAADGAHAAAPAEAATAGAGADRQAFSQLLRPAVLGLLSLLLSPHQPKSALQLIDAAITSCPVTGRATQQWVGGAVSTGASATGAAAADGSGVDGARLGCAARGVDVTLLRIKAALLLSLADTGSALEVLARAKQRVGMARHAAGAADRHAAREYALMEAQVWRELAVAYAGQRQGKDAADCVAQAELTDPHSADTAHIAGVVAEAAGDSGAAVACYEKALAIQPSHAPALRSLGTLLRRKGGSFDTAVASSLLADALRYDSSSYQGWFNYGSIETGTEAERHLHHAVMLAAAAPIVDCGELPLLL